MSAPMASNHELFQHDFDNALWRAIKMLQRLEQCLVQTNPDEFPNGFDSPSWHGCYNEEHEDIIAQETAQRGLIVAILQTRCEQLHPLEIHSCVEYVGNLRRTIIKTAQRYGIKREVIRPPATRFREASESQGWMLTTLVYSKTLQRDCLLYDLVHYWVNQTAWRACLAFPYERVAAESACALIKATSMMPGVDIHWKNKHGVSAGKACLALFWQHDVYSESHNRFIVDNICDRLLYIAKLPGCRVQWEDTLGITIKSPILRSAKNWENAKHGFKQNVWDWSQAGVDALSRLCIDNYHIEKPPFSTPVCVIRNIMVPSQRIQRIIITNCTLACSFKFLDDFSGLTHVRLQNNLPGKSHHLSALLPGRLRRYTQMDPREILAMFYEMTFWDRASVNDSVPFGRFVKSVIALPWDVFATVMEFDVI